MKEQSIITGGNISSENAFPEELSRLAETEDKLDIALNAAQEDVQRLDMEYREGKRYMAEYRSEFDSRLLYIACTRAMHGLTLYYIGEPSGCLPAEVCK